VIERAQQREKTRTRIVEVAVEVFAAKGFRAASTREIAARARVSQALITYHFRSKGDLWKAAMGRIFEELRQSFRSALDDAHGGDPVARVRDVVRQYVRFVAAHPELFRVMVEEGKRPDARMRWLVDTHLKPLYAAFARNLEAVRPVDGAHPARPDGGGAHPAHVYYAMAGAASLLFAVAPECQRLTGLDPRSPEVVDAHAEMLVRLLVP
jgi:TetR/AcrR family transcriptional regulator